MNLEQYLAHCILNSSFVIVGCDDRRSNEVQCKRLLWSSGGDVCTMCWYLWTWS